MTSLAIRAKERLFRLIDQFHDSDGLGGDFYFDKLLNHPMADAKYLSTLGQMHVSGVLSANRYRHYCKDAIDRLENSAIKLEQGVGWGLGFAWDKHGYTEHDPLLINSSIVTKALITLQEPVQDRNSETLSLNAVEGLDWWCQSQTSEIDGIVRLPVYGLSSYREPIINSAIYALAVLNSYYGEDRFTQSTNYVLTIGHPGLGWSYAHDNPVIDLLHQWYIIGGLFDIYGVDAIEEISRFVLGQFSSVNGFFDKAKLVELDHRTEEEKALYLCRTYNNRRLLFSPKIARLWSLGEMLVGATKISNAIPESLFWKRWVARITEILLEYLQDDRLVENQYPRHTMHAAHGLACYLALKRNQPLI